MKKADEVSNLNDWLKSGFLLGLRHAASPDSYLIGWGAVKRHKTLPKGQPALFASDFFLEDQCPWWTFENLAILSKAQLQEKLSPISKSSKILKVEWEAPDETKFEEDFAAIQNAIEIGVLEKAVPVTFERAELKIDVEVRAGLVTNLLSSHGERTVYGLWQEDFGILGASPEILFAFDDSTGDLETMALAGTRKTDNEKQISLLLDPKEIYEHNVVVQDLRRKLKNIGDLSITEPYVWDLGMISHLRTDVKVKIKKQANRSVAKLIRLIHPTPALGVASEVESFKWLKNLSGADRRARFGAPFGIAQLDGHSEILVAIRNLQWAANEVLLGSGCGIVAPSNAEREWQELELKRRSVKALFKL